MDHESIIQVLEFIKTINDFKSTDRLTLIGPGKRKESDAEHCWHVAMFTMLLARYYDQPLDHCRAVRMALVHDLVELYALDTYAFASDEERAKKQERELVAAQKLFIQLPPPLDTEMRDLWDEYELKETPEAKYVSAIDKLMPRITNRLSRGGAPDTPIVRNEARKQQQDQIVKDTSPVFKFLFDKISEEKL